MVRISRAAAAASFAALGIAVSGSSAAEAQALDPGLQIQVDVGGTKLVASGAITDDLATGVRRVLVRVVDEMDLEIRFEKRRDP